MSLESIETKSFLNIMEDDEYEALPIEWPVSVHMMAGAAAGIMEHAAMYPIDCVKVMI